MKIKYQFADGKVAEIEVSEELGTLYLETERQEIRNSSTSTSLMSSGYSMPTVAKSLYTHW